METIAKSPVTRIQFDDLITSVHTKCKPVSVSLAVNSDSREILGVEVSEIPARPPLVKISIVKYGRRRNERPISLRRLFASLSSIAHPNAIFRSDCDPEYPSHIKKQFAGARHERVKSRRARAAGFGELKRVGYDPIFALNHTCAMLRANINRLARQTWCTTKTKVGLILHLELYRHYHNTCLLGLNAG